MTATMTPENDMRTRDRQRKAVFAGWAIALAIVAMSAAVVAQEGAALDGKQFSIQLADASGESHPDVLVFVDGTFESTDCTQYGFTAATYATSSEGDAVSFTAIATSPAEGSMTWTGQITGQAVEGHVTWSKEGQASVEYSFSGSLATGE